MTSARDWDASYEEYTISEIRKHPDGGWDMHLVRIKDGAEDPTDDCAFWCPPDSPVKPAVDMRARLYVTAHEEGRVRGLFLDGVEVFYRTEAEDVVYARERLAELRAKHRAKYEELKEELAARIARLPEVFQQRIARLRANAPETFWQHEALEVLVAEAAVNVQKATDKAVTTAVATARARGLTLDAMPAEQVTAEVYKSFAVLPRPLQERFIPELAGPLDDQQVVFAVGLAHALARGWSETIVNMHAAGCAAGPGSCAECGCFDPATLARLQAEQANKPADGECGPCDHDCDHCTRHEKEVAVEMIEQMRRLADHAQGKTSTAWWNQRFGQSA